MNINRNNYEEFLLLYIDEELSSTQQKEVEFFLEQHSDIKQKFDLLLDTKLQLDEVSFGDITSLLKTENNEVCLDNYEEKFLLYVDGELCTNEKKKVELFVLQHPTLQTAFTTINKAKIPVAIVAYPNKESLYKTERKPVILYLQKMAVAAVFIGLIAFVWNLIGSNKKQDINVVKTTPVINNNITPIGNKKVKTVETLSTTSTKNIEKKIDKLLEKKNSIIFNGTQETRRENIEVVKNIVNPVLPSTQKVEPNVQTVINKPSNNDVVVSIKTNATNPEISNTTTAPQTNINKPQTIAIVYKTLDTDDEADNGLVQQSKLKSLFKKATKIFSSKNTANDDEPKKLFVVTL